MKTIATLTIRPSERMDAIAASHAQELPRAIRFLARRTGLLEPSGAGMLSYLLFERGYCRHLIDLGYTDAISRRAEILALLNYGSANDESVEVRMPLDLAEADQSGLPRLSRRKAMQKEAITGRVTRVIDSADTISERDERRSAGWNTMEAIAKVLRRDTT